MTPKLFAPIAILGLYLLASSACSHLSTVPVQRTVPTPDSADLPCLQTPHDCIALNPDVTDATLKETICHPGYTRTVRPSTGYTNGVKRKLMRDAGLDPATSGRYELDHRIPLALGGHPRKPSNLALQPWDGEHGARRKDRLEARLHVEVCRGVLTLLEAQHCIADDWEACAARTHTPAFDNSALQ